MNVTTIEMGSEPNQHRQRFLKIKVLFVFMEELGKLLVQMKCPDRRNHHQNSH